MYAQLTFIMKAKHIIEKFAIQAIYDNKKMMTDNLYDHNRLAVLKVFE